LITESTFNVLLNYFVSTKIFYKDLVIPCFLFYKVSSSFYILREKNCAQVLLNIVVVSQMRFHRRRQPTTLVAQMTNSYPCYLNVSSMLAWTWRFDKKLKNINKLTLFPIQKWVV